VVHETVKDSIDEVGVHEGEAGVHEGEAGVHEGDNKPLVIAFTIAKLLEIEFEMVK